MSQAHRAGADGVDEGVREPRDARRRRQLVEATIASIARHGLAGTTVARVAEGAGLSAGIVNFYFKSKNALLLATLETVNGQLEQLERDAVADAGDDPAAQLNAMIEVNFDPEVCDPDRIAVWNAFWGQAQTRPDYMRICGARETAEEDLVLALFERLAEGGGYEQLDHHALGSAFYHLLTSLPEGILERDTPFDFDRAKATCRGFLTSVFPREFPRAQDSLTKPPAPQRADSASGPTPVPSETSAAYDTLPTWLYHDREFYELEKQHIFMSSWLLVGHTSHAPQPGDYMTLEVAGERALVIRGADQKLRAFHNTCRHRASRLVRGDTGNCRSAIVCPYHGFTYDFDGSLRQVPAEDSFKGLDKSKLGLFELALEEWMGFVFVRFRGTGASIADAMRPFADEAQLYRFEEMKPWGARSSSAQAFDWKLFAENDAEGYHIPTGHPGLRRLFGNSYAQEGDGEGDGSRAFSVLREQESSNWAERAYQRILPVVEHLPRELQRAWVYYAMFPSAVLQVSPDLVDCYQVLPTGPGECQLMTFQVALDDERREMRAARYLTSRIVRQVVKEDLDFCRWTYAGVRSDGYQGGVLSELEGGVRALHDRIRGLIPVAGCAEKPTSLHGAASDLASINAAMQSNH